jgi:ribosomal protein L22
MYAVTGYAQQATDEQLKNLTKNAAVIGQLRQGANLRGIQADSAIVSQVAEATGMARADVYSMLQPDPVSGLDYVPKTARASGGGGRGSAVERIASQLRASDPEMTLRDSFQQAMELTSRQRGGSQGGGTNEGRFIKDYQDRNPDASYEDALAAYRTTGKDERTAGQKNIEYSEEAADELDQAFDGNFLAADLNNLTPEQERVVNRNINRIEQVGGLKLSTEEKKNARAIRKLLPTATTAATKLTDDQTGLIDSTLRQVKSYVSNNVPGKDGTIAYENLRALGRNALFGSQVSSADYKAFNKAVASLGEQTGPVLASMKQQLQLMRDDINAAADLGDPYVAKVRYGTTLEGLDKIVNSLDERIELIQRGQTSGPAGGQTNSGIKVRVTPNANGAAPAAAVSGERPSLDSIFGGQQ